MWDVIFILAAPFVYYLAIKLGTYAFLQARSNFEQDQERKKRNGRQN